MQVGRHNDTKSRLILLCADHTSLGGLNLWVEWNDTFGLCKGYWGECGGDDEEAQPLSSDPRGLPAANVPGQRIIPGRNQWMPGVQLPDSLKALRGGFLLPAQYMGISC